MSEETTENWLEAEVFNCSNCMNELHRVFHSPFYDCDFFYCDSCAKRVEIGFYDKVRRQILSKFEGEIVGQNQRLQEIENNLRACDCGGHFKYDAPRRCVYCAAVVIDEGGGIDLYPSYAGIFDKEKEPTVKDQEKFEKFEKEFARTENIWK